MKLILVCGALVISTIIASGTVHKDIPQDTQVTLTDQNTPSFSETTNVKEDTLIGTSQGTDNILGENNTESHTDVKINSEPVDTPAAVETPTVNTSDWNLLLVNPWNKIPDDFSVGLTQLKNGHAIDERVYPDLQDMMDAMRAEGLSPLICSSYRTNEKQQTLYNNQVSKYLARGYSQSEAEAEAGKWVAVPGTSEHQTGLAVDIVDINYQLLDEKQEDTAVQKWLMENSYKYGFILRYPSDKSDITGINYEPWHYRYVGKEAAKEIYEQGICLEEYLDGIN